MNFFSSSKKSTLSKREIEAIFLMLRGFLKIGFTPIESMRELSKNESSDKRKKVLDEIIYEAQERNKPIPSILLTMNLISPIEEIIMKNSNSMVKAIDDIIEIRNTKSKFEKMVFSILFFPISLFLITMGSLVFARETVMDYLTYMAKIGESSGRGVSKIEAPLPMMYPVLNEYIFYGTIIAVVVGYVGYKYLYKYNASLIYKIFPLKAYDDAPLIFQLMFNMQETGMVISDIIEKMIKYVRPQSLSIMFEDINKKINTNRNFYPVFKTYGFPGNLVSIIEIGEKTYTLWDNLPALIEFSKTTINTKISNIQKYFGIILKYVVMLFTIFVLLITYLDVLMTSMQLMTG